jgi:hypothetical protein
MSRTLSRRTVLRGGAGMTITLPLLEATAGRALAAPPPRVVFMVNPHGTFPERFWPMPAGVAAPTEDTPSKHYSTGSTALETSDYTLSPILQPVAAHRKDMCIVEGIDNLDGQEGHRNLGALLTSRPPSEQASVPFGTGTSVDQVLGARMPTRIPSLQLGVRAGQPTTAFGCLSWYDTFKPAPNQGSPQAVFERLFGAANLDKAALDRLQLERRSVLDAALAQATDLRKALGAPDQRKLDGYLSSFRELETRLQASAGGAGCGRPTLGASGKGDFPGISEQQLSLATAALACDLTRVISIQYGHEGTIATMPHIGIDEPLHTVSHAGDRDAAGYVKIEAVHKWYATQFALFLDKLAAVPEGGARLLDNTLVVWVNAMNKGNQHNNWNIPCVLAGNQAGRYRMGRYIRLPRDATQRYRGRNKFVRGRSMGDLHCTILRTMGVPADTFGDPYFFNGPLDAQLLR